MERKLWDKSLSFKSLSLKRKNLLDAYVDSWFWMRTPYWLITLAAIYLWFVLVAAPAFMKNRKACNLTILIRCYNLFQIVCCLAILIIIPSYDFSLKYSWICDNDSRGSYEEIPHIQLRWFWGGNLVLVLRASEYLETVFYVFRKKQNQVTVLHVFHHIAVTFLLWVFGKYGLEKNGGFVIVVNSAVHVIMYAYFVVSSFESTRSAAEKYKKQMTMFQIIQLLLLLGHSVRMIVSCNAPVYYLLLAPSVATLVALFINFYVRTYVLEKKTKIM